MASSLRKANVITAAKDGRPQALLEFVSKEGKVEIDTGPAIQRGQKTSSPKVNLAKIQDHANYKGFLDSAPSLAPTFWVVVAKFVTVSLK